MGNAELIANFRRVVTRHYFDFHGRATRAQFWQYVLVYLAITILVDFIGFRILSALWLLGLCLPTAGVTIRRLHDIGRSGWWLLLPIVPAFLMGSFFFVFWPLTMVLGLTFAAFCAYLIYLYLLPGTQGGNRYGPDPKAASA